MNWKLHIIIKLWTIINNPRSKFIRLLHLKVFLQRRIHSPVGIHSPAGIYFPVGI